MSTTAKEGHPRRRISLTTNSWTDETPAMELSVNVRTSCVYHPGKYWYEGPGAHIAEIYARYLVHTRTYYRLYVHDTYHNELKYKYRFVFVFMYQVLVYLRPV